MTRNASNARLAAILLATAGFTATLASSSPTRADTLNQYLNNVAQARVGSFVGTYNTLTELALINIYTTQYLFQQTGAGVPGVGGGTLNGEMGAHIMNPGDTATLNFQFIDP